MERLSGASILDRPEAKLPHNDMLIRISDSNGRVVQPESYTITKDGTKAHYNFTQEIANIDRIRSDFDRKNNVNTRNRLLSWDPVKSRNRFEQCETEEEREAWKQNERDELTTTLRERYNSLENPMDLYFDDEGHMRNRMFPTDTIETILRRGVAYQETHGSKELERERSEVIGILTVEDDLHSENAQDGDTRIIFSPPGMVKDSPYTKHFVDKYTLRIDQATGNRIIDAKRFATVMDYEQYKEAALALDPSYFDGETGPLDAILLRKPLKLDGIGNIDGLLDSLLTFDPDALRGYEFEIINQICEPIKPFLIHAVLDWNPKLIAWTLNTILHIGDEAEGLLKDGNMDGLQSLLVWSQSLTRADMFQEIRKRGKMRVEERKVGCGDSGSLENSVGKYGLGGAENDPNLRCMDTECSCVAAHFHCPGEKSVRIEEDGKWVRKEVQCKEVIRVGKGITTCPTCGEGKKC